MLAHIDQDNIADYFLAQSCSWAVGQHCAGKQFSCATLAQADQDNIVHAMLSKRIRTTMHRKKILLNVVLIFSGQHCTGQNPMQCCP